MGDEPKWREKPLNLLSYVFSLSLKILQHCGNQFYVLVVGFYLNYSMHNHFLLVKAKKINIRHFRQQRPSVARKMSVRNGRKFGITLDTKMVQTQIFYQQYVSLVCLFHRIFFVKGDQGMEIQRCVRTFVPYATLSVCNAQQDSGTLHIVVLPCPYAYRRYRECIIVSEKAFQYCFESLFKSFLHNMVQIHFFPFLAKTLQKVSAEMNSNVLKDVSVMACIHSKNLMQK